MKLSAQTIPYSSIVGGGLSLLDEKGAVRFLVVLMGSTAGITKAETAAMARQIGGYINKLGLEVPDRPAPPALPPEEAK